MNNNFLQIKSQINLIISNYSKEVIKNILSKERLRFGKVSLINYVSLSILLQKRQVKNIKKFYQEELSLYVKDKPSYANFLKNLHNIMPLIKHILFNLIRQNNYVVFNYFKKAEQLNKPTCLIVDSTKLETSNYYKRKAKSHKYLYDAAQVGHSSLGEYYGFKLNIIITEDNKIIDLAISSGNTHDIDYLEKIEEKLKIGNRILLGDAGYVSKKIKDKLKKKKINLITKLRKNMNDDKYYTKEEKEIYYKNYAKRQQIERFFKKLKEDFNLKNLNYAKSDNNFLNKIFSNLLLTQIF